MSSTATTSSQRKSPPAVVTARKPVWQNRTLQLGLLSGLLWWASLPPLGLFPLAWLAPLPWLSLIARDELPGRRPYVVLWLATVCLWLAILHWLTLPHWATAIGWVALSAYLAIFTPVWVALSRVAVHRLRWPLAVAAPVMWVGLEFLQAHALTGFAMGNLCHSQYRWLSILQIADLAGMYTISFVMLLVAACVYTTAARWHSEPPLRSALPAAVGLAVLAAAWGYGQWRLSAPVGKKLLQIALIQGSIDTELTPDPKKPKPNVYDQYLRLSQRAKRERPDTEMIIWPETMFNEALRVYTRDVELPPGAPVTLEELKAACRSSQVSLAGQALRLDSPMILGVDTYVYGHGQILRYNSAAFITRGGQIVGRYDKNHPVMFGEYIPLGKQWPWLYSLVPIGALDDGVDLTTFKVGDCRMATNICYESVLPHLVRDQVAELRARGEEPDLLVNLSNDGWFWGSSELDLHLICGVLRAVECRKPLVIAANTGFSAWIDSSGAILSQGPRRATGVVHAAPTRDGRRSPYLLIGDIPAALCLAVCALAAGVSGRDRWRARRRVATA